jgi:hypothetical protein
MEQTENTERWRSWKREGDEEVGGSKEVGVDGDGDVVERWRRQRDRDRGMDEKVEIEKMEKSEGRQRGECGEDGAVGEDAASEGYGEGVKKKRRRKWRWRR